MKKQSFDAEDIHNNDVSLAVVALESGKFGDEQSPAVRRLLRTLETEGLAEYSETRGWKLTPTGRARARTFIKSARAARKRP